MKKITFHSLYLLLSILITPLMAQENTPHDSLGLPGDNLNLYGALNLFQQSETLEAFEKKINNKNSKINNLDLNEDNNTDYINVIDNINGTAHSIVLQIAINEKETQDVAVIEVEKNKDNQPIIQIIGDEALYGKDYIIEPNEEKATEGTPNPGYNKEGNSTTINNYTTYQPVASWAIIGYMYQPSYRVYVSPYRWSYYPNYWSPWRPIGYHTYYGYNRRYNNYYRRGYSYRAPIAHAHYGPRRTTSITVINKRQSGAYRATYKKPAVRQNSPQQKQPVQNTNRIRTNNASPARDKNQAPAPKTNENKRPQRTNASQKQGGNKSVAPRGQGGNKGGGNKGGGKRGR